MNEEGEYKMIRKYSSLFFKLLMALALFFVCFNAYAQETMTFDSEAKKLEFIRQMLKKEKYLRPSIEDESLFATNCKVMMKDLLAGKNFKAIEPDVRADSIEDPRIAKWRQCEGKDYHDFKVDPQHFFDWLKYLGAPPYRYYRIELDGNKKNGPEDMIYHNQPDKPPKLGRTGYTWVDLKNCEIKRGGGFIVMGKQEMINSNAVFLNLLIYYKNQLWAIEYIDSFEFALYHWIDRERMETCRWRLFKPE